MTLRTFVTVAAVATAILAGSQPAHAEGRYDFKVPFNFVANGKALTAGNYVLSVNETQETVALEPKDTKGSTVTLLVETRLSENTSLAEPEVVFDRLNGQLALSELLIPGDDGYLMLATRAKHTHQSLKGVRLTK